MIEKLPVINKKNDSVLTKSQQKQRVHEEKQHEVRRTRTNEKKVNRFRILNYMFYNLN